MKRNELRAMLLEQPYDALVLTSEPTLILWF